MRWFWLLGLTLAAWEDLRRREFPYWILGVWLVPGAVYAVMSGIGDHLIAAAVGAVMLLLSKATRGALGEGDGLFFLLTACYLRFLETAALFLMGLGVSGVWSMGILLRSRWRADTCAGDTVPFLTCVWLPGVWLVCRQLGAAGP